MSVADALIPVAVWTNIESIPFVRRARATESPSVPCVRLASSTACPRIWRVAILCTPIRRNLTILHPNRIECIRLCDQVLFLNFWIILIIIIKGKLRFAAVTHLAVTIWNRVVASVSNRRWCVRAGSDTSLKVAARQSPIGRLRSISKNSLSMSHVRFGSSVTVLSFFSGHKVLCWWTVWVVWRMFQNNIDAREIFERTTK